MTVATRGEQQDRCSAGQGEKRHRGESGEQCRLARRPRGEDGKGAEIGFSLCVIFAAHLHLGEKPVTGKSGFT